MLEDIKVWLVGSLLVGMAIPPLVKASVAWVRKSVDKGLDYSQMLHEVHDPLLRAKLQKVALAVVEVVEYLVPDRGKGAEKFAKADAMMSTIPFLAALPNLRKALIEWACEMMWGVDDTLKNNIKANQQPPDDPETATKPPEPPAA